MRGYQLKRLSRWDVQLGLVLLAAITWILPVSSYAIQAVTSLGPGGPIDPTTLIYAAIGLLGAIVTLLGGMVMVVRGLIKHRSPEVRSSDALSKFVAMIEEHERKEERELAGLRDEHDRLQKDMDRIHDRLSRILETK